MLQNKTLPMLCCLFVNLPCLRFHQQRRPFSAIAGGAAHWMAQHVVTAFPCHNRRQLSTCPAAAFQVKCLQVGHAVACLAFRVLPANMTDWQQFSPKAAAGRAVDSFVTLQLQGRGAPDRAICTTVGLLFLLQIRQPSWDLTVIQHG